MDGNESICGACLKSGELICCENCPAAFHPECAGYRSIDSVPDGDWFCFLCSRKLRLLMVDTSPFEGEVGQTVMISSDAFGEVFYKAKVEEIDLSTVTVRGIDNPRKVEILSNTDKRIWRGTVDPISWTSHGDNYRPNSRAFEIDYEGIARDTEETSTVPEVSPWLYAKNDSPEEKAFLEILERFWKIKFDSESIPWPPFGYIVPLTELWEVVQEYGGYDIVSQNDSWDIVASKLSPLKQVAQFPFMLKHTFRLILLEVERAGGRESVETIANLTRSTNEETKKNTEEQSSSFLEEEGPRKRLRREKRGLRSAEDILGSSESVTNEDDFLSGEGVFSHKRRIPRKPTASRAVQEYRSSIGVVSLTSKAKALRKGDHVDVRLYKNSSLGPWRLGEILTVSTASAFEGYRRFHVKFLSQKDDNRHQVSTEWVPILARPSAWGTALSKPSVLVRPCNEPHFPPVKGDAANWQRHIGARVEAWLHNGWWPARIADIRNGSALLQGDVIPLGEGLKWISTFKYIREAPKNENSGYGMVQPLNLKEEVCPKEMENRLDVTVDKAPDGQLILRFRRLDDIKRS